MNNIKDYNYFYNPYSPSLQEKLWEKLWKNEYYKMRRREIEELACYLVSMFYKTDRKYFCTRPKIKRLLTIYKLSAINFDSDCFHYIFYADDQQVTLSSSVSAFVDRDVYFNLGTVNGKTEIISEDNKEFFDGNFNETVSILNKYIVNENEIDKIKRDLLEAIFRKFGSYSSRDLNNMLNEFSHEISFEKRVDENAYIYFYLDPNKFMQFLNSEHNNNLYQNNELFNFIKIIVNEFKSNDFDNDKTLNHVLKLVKG